MIKPEHVEIIQKSSLELEVRFRLEESLFYLQGHFEKKKLLPGVVQVGYAIEYAREYLTESITCDIPRIKFTSPILPSDEVLLTLKINPEHKYLEFEYYLLNINKSASTGRIKIK